MSEVLTKFAEERVDHPMTLCSMCRGPKLPIPVGDSENTDAEKMQSPTT